MMKNSILILMFIILIFASDFIYSQRGGDDRVKRIETERKGRIKREIVRVKDKKSRTPIEPVKRYKPEPPQRPPKTSLYDYQFPVREEPFICTSGSAYLDINLDTYVHISTKESGIEKIEMEDYEGAISDFTIVMEEDPYDKELYYHRDFAYNKIEQFDSAEIDLSNAIYLDYYYMEAYFQRGVARVNLGKTNAAVNDFHTADSLKLVLDDLSINQDY
jgi:tetratricopeptide (TPR) repeat protein